MEPKPHVLAVVLCDYIAPADNGKFTLVGTCSKLWASKFPAHFPSLGVFISLNSVPNGGELNLILRSDDSKHAITLPSIVIKNAPSDRREIFQSGGVIQNVTFPEPGMWEFVVAWNGNQIATHPIWVNQRGGV